MKTILDLGFRECRWPICATGGEHQFCAEMTELGDVYCPEHTRLAAPEDQRVDANLKRLAREHRVYGGLVRTERKNLGLPAKLTHFRAPNEEVADRIPDLVELFEGAWL